MTHLFFVSMAYGAAALGLGGLVLWIIVDHRSRKFELAGLEASGVRRRSDSKAETQA